MPDLQTPVVDSLRQTCVAVPSQWEGTLFDGRSLYIRFRHGELSVGVGDSIDEAVQRSAFRHCIFTGHIGGSLDGYMTFDELKEILDGILVFPSNLVVEDERPLTLSFPTGLTGSPDRGD